MTCVICLSAATASAKPWRGVTPLRSTRSDVEKLLGPPTQEDAGYVFENERAQIIYSSQRCQEDLPGGWNVPHDTVAEIQVTPIKDLSVTDLPVNWQSLEPIYSVRSSRIDYLDDKEGTRYTTQDGFVRTITYLASAQDKKEFACAPYKYAASVAEGAKLIRFEQYPFDSYSRIPFEDARVRLDLFASQLQDTIKARPNSRGFIIVYAGQAAHKAEAKTIADCAKNYLVKVRGADPESIVAVDAGYQNELKVELYILPNDAYPPMLKPTVSPKRVQILDGEFEPCKEAK